MKNGDLLHGELPQRRHGGEHLLSKIFYASNSKWLNAPIYTSGRRVQALVTGTCKPLHESPLSPLLSICSPPIMYFPTWAVFSLMTLNLCIS